MVEGVYDNDMCNRKKERKIVPLASSPLVYNMNTSCVRQGSCFSVTEASSVWLNRNKSKGDDWRIPEEQAVVGQSKDTSGGPERSIKAVTSEQKQAAQSVPADINELEPFLFSVLSWSFQDQSHGRGNLSDRAGVSHYILNVLGKQKQFGSSSLQASTMGQTPVLDFFKSTDKWGEEMFPKKTRLPLERGNGCWAICKILKKALTCDHRTGSQPGHLLSSHWP